MGLTLVPLGIEALFWHMNWFSAFPTYLFLSAVQVVVMVLVYRRLLEWQGELLQRREQTILEIVAGRSS
jgi:hypothetical protein